ncbi:MULTISPECIES: bifunctional DNA-formamidopyrimidine glycosylase/DNA-(apurinic or apyrimidinic site) lyase [Acidobacteriaceae]|uniref:bifunctional DNA-formamidopyrimidine glycosylase/DNA-(apurinic or apyrimidinic site) lyase n=1 Tax=Acidobacteriaceae TaxID=204434 RepID=UPI00131D22A8|nr:MULTISPECIES: bifunctional DNA-formamidopyrimidine glycosylase/DNA-(apurinic or apyrimidinic site) lyase [Acidobacteriaceae]MDW5267211.1 bifunctional DNA-formamidopyrimidine glycosylase/DNA-(apurinic or apyrimidinic site) lyase [Edaphobacter sp.]
MPELPEVETVANGVHDRTHGQTIRSVWTSNKPQTFKTPPDQITEALTNSRIDRVHRVGKTIVMDLTRNRKAAQFLIHLGMTGRLLVSDPKVPIPAHTHAILTLSSGRELRFVDPRRFGRLSIADATYEGPGSEPLTIALEDFIALFRNRKTPIKAALLNQSLLHGVGNIYADESLFRAGIRPRRQAGRLTHAELERLRTALIDVLKHAIKLGGSSVSDYVDAEGIAGFFQFHHNVYSRTGEPCRVCKTPIQRIVIGGRSTHFCPACQK